MFELPMSNMMKLDVLKYNVEFYMTDSRERKRTVSVIIRKRAVMKKHFWSEWTCRDLAELLLIHVPSTAVYIIRYNPSQLNNSALIALLAAKI